MIDNSVIIIAEAGVNHNGDVVLAKKLIDVAKDCGVDYIKFQTFKAKNLVSKKKSHSRSKCWFKAGGSLIRVEKKRR